jgi:hypothetical protein
LAFHSFSEEFQGCLAITAFRDIALQDFPFVIDRSPKVVGLSVDLHENFVQVPLPVRIRPQLLHPLSPDLGSKHQAESVPPKSNRLMADVDAALMQKHLLHSAARAETEHTS